MPNNLSISSLFLQADLVVQSVLVALALASVVTWTVLIAKGLAFIAALTALRQAVRRAESEPNLASLQARLQHGETEAERDMVEAAVSERRLSASAEDAGVKERIAARLQRIEAACGRRMATGTGVLASIGATAPFVGLFGTVWGIMHSFIGIAQSHTTNLAVVAPGIAEALLATAAGLVAAIPAVVIYNLFVRGISAYRAGLADLSVAVQILVSRDLDRHDSTLKLVVG